MDSDVIEAAQGDSGLVETPEARAEEPKAEKPKRTRTRKKAPAKSADGIADPSILDTPAEPAAEG
ncbi:hypothetical protein [Jannaschia pohangensis]|nr:hypothetical protein [Jannaschia pohangensis]